MMHIHRPLLLLFLGWVLLGCQSGCSTRDDAVPLGSPDAAGGDSDFAPSWEAGEYTRSIEVDQRTRTFRLYVPRSYKPPSLDADTTYPLVLILHGGGGDGDGMAAVGFDALADSNGFIAVYPDAIDKRWADGRGTTDPAKEGVDDVKFIEELIARLSEVLPVDADEVFVAGVSNGGMMAHTLGCELSEDIAAIGVVIAAMPSKLAPTCNPSHPVSVIAIQGTDDPFIPIDGGDSAHEDFPRLGAGGEVESAAQTRAKWAAIDGCGEPTVENLNPKNPDDPTRVQRHRYTDCDENTGVDYYVVSGMGHTWPPREGVAPRLSGAQSTQLDATELIWSFFATHGR